MKKWNISTGWSDGDDVVRLPVVNWKKFAEMNAKRQAKGYEPIPSDEWAQGVAEMPRIIPPMTKAGIEHIQNYLYQHNREPLTEREILELEGHSMDTLKTSLDAIESAYQAAKAAGAAQVESWRKLGLPLPADTDKRIAAEALVVRDQAVLAAREDLVAATQRIRESHRPLRDQARKLMYPSVDKETSDYLGEALKRVSSLADLQRLYSDCQTDGGKFYLEVHGAERLTTDWDKNGGAQAGGGPTGADRRRRTRHTRGGWGTLEALHESRG